jgi:hypothetical protein
LAQLEAINLDSAGQFAGDWSDIAPAIERQDARTQAVARLFIAFFKGELDLPTLKARLAEQQ